MREGPEPSGEVTKPWSGGGRGSWPTRCRRLIAQTVTSTAPPDVLADAARRASLLADELDAHVPEPGWRTHGPVLRPLGAPRRGGTALASAMPFDVIIGSCNPLALPIDIDFEPPKAIGRAVFTAPYEGAPGLRARGGVGRCIRHHAHRGERHCRRRRADGSLTIRYLKPTRWPNPSCSRRGSPRSRVVGPTAGAGSSRTAW